ncbi:MYND-type zinc finger-containing chromatin reader ZMYND8 isoform X2 [Polyergus mexicanus]
MASHVSCEGSVKSPATDKIDATAQLKDDEKESSIISSANKHDEPNNAIDTEEKKSLTLDTSNEYANVQEKDADNVKSEKKHDPNSPVIVKKQLDDSEADKKQEAQNVDKKQETSNADTQKTKKEKDIKNEDDKDSVAKMGSALKRKRKSLSISTATESSVEESTRSKRKKLKSASDQFCWRCHKENVDAHCTACPRSWHRKCIGGMPSSLEKWICGECATILKAENAETRSLAMAQLSVDQLCMLLKHVVERLRDYPGSEPFSKPVDLAEVPNYLDYVVKPMDLSLLESNVRSKLYGSTDAFMADAKWIQHNCIVFNTCGGVYADTLKLTNAAKQIIKVARQEVSEIEACPDCYAHGRNLPRPQPSWFIEPCRRPHPLVWAKLKGFPFWPAKAMPRVNSQGFVDVRFFGEHDRAWVPPKDLYLYSEEPPAPSPRKRKSDMDECVREITRHCRKLALMYGQFKFAPPKVQYNPNDPMQIKLMLPNYNPLEPNNYFSNSELSVTPKKKTVLRKRNLSIKGKSQNDESIDNGEINTNSKENDDKDEKASEATTPKVQKSDIIDVKGTPNSQTNLDDKLKKKIQIETVAQNRTVKSEKSKNAKALLSRLNNLVTNNVAGTSNATISNVNKQISEKNNSKSKNEPKSSENSPKPVTPPTNELSNMTRTQKRSLLKNIINPKLALSQTENASKSVVKSSKVYKPKTRMVDKLNAEKALKSILASKENEKLSSSNSPSATINKTSLLNNKELSGVQKIPEIDITLSPTSMASNAKVTHAISSSSSTNVLNPVTDKSVVLFVVNNGKTEAAKQTSPTVDYPVTKEHNSLIKKESKAKKTFPSKSRNPQNTSPRPLFSTDEFTQISPNKQETSSTYQLLPPQAGPISARLHQNANELARRMGQLMEEAYKEAAQTYINGENGTAENCQAIFFLKMQMEHMKWKHQQQLAELKHNTDRTMCEMRASLEAEKLRLLEEVRKEAEDEKLRCVEETKRKQWCAKCGREAMFYCCWNTAYCDYPCQQSHWSIHMRTCSQQPTYTNLVASSGVNSSAQQSSKTMTHDPAGRVYALPPSKLSGIPSSWPASSLKNKTDQDIL